MTVTKRTRQNAAKIFSEKILERIGIPQGLIFPKNQLSTSFIIINNNTNKF